MTKGHDISTQQQARCPSQEPAEDPLPFGPEDWKRPYLECFSSMTLSEGRRAALREQIRNEPLGPTGGLAPVQPSAQPSSTLHAGPPSLLSRLHRSGLGYVAAAAAAFAVYSVSGERRADTSAGGPIVDSGVLRYARVLPADFDLEGDAAALPSVVSEVTGGGEPSEEAFELRLPDSLRHVYVPREGRFFTLPSGKLAVAIQMRPQRAGVGKTKTLFLMPHQPSVGDVLPHNNMAQFVNLPAGGAAVISGERSNAWRSGGLNYMLMDQ